MTAPFQTLEKAQAALEEMGTIPCTALLLNGTYPRTQTLELFATNDQNKTWMAYPSQVPVLDGGSSVTNGINVGQRGITIQGLTVQHYKQVGIGVYNTGNVNLIGNSLLNITSPSWQSGSTGASLEVSNTSNMNIKDNVISGNTAFGMLIGPATSATNAALTISGNTVTNVCTATSDCGGIYLGAGASTPSPYVLTGYTVTGNTVSNVGTSATLGNSIYLDNNMSNVTVTKNIIFGKGAYGIDFHGGLNNVFKNNIVDITQMAGLGAYQDCVTSDNSACMSTSPMTGNVIEDNIVYSGSTNVPGHLWFYYNSSGESIANPTVMSNIYFDPFAVLPNTGQIVDGNPLDENPLFVDPAGNNYTLEPGSPASMIGF